MVKISTKSAILAVIRGEWIGNLLFAAVSKLKTAIGNLLEPWHDLDGVIGCNVIRDLTVEILEHS